MTNGYKGEPRVSFELAELFKNKGYWFYKDCFYDKNGTFVEKVPAHIDRMYMTSAPTLSGAQRWLKEKHRIHVYVVPNRYNNFRVIDYKLFIWDFHVELNKIDGGVFKTYYEALEEGLKIGVEKIN